MMDSQERHELKENELAEFLSNFGEWWSKYGNAVLLVLVIAAGSFAGYRLYHNWTTTSVDLAFAELASTTTVDGYARVAEDNRQPAVRALAYLRGGDAAMSEAMRLPLAVQPTEDEAGTAPMTRDEALQRAEGMYRRALDVARHPAFRVNALIGLARVAETQGQWDQAAEHYRQAEQLATANHLPTQAAAARRGEAMLAQLQQPVVFAPASAETELPAFDASADFMQDGGVPFEFQGFDEQPAPMNDQPQGPAEGGDEPAAEAPAAAPAETDQPGEADAPAPANGQ